MPHELTPDTGIDLDSHDLDQALCYAKGFCKEDIAEVIAADGGCNDGDNWVAIFKLHDGRYAYLSAGCDYTGWDCRSWGHSFIYDSLEELQ